MAGADLVTYGRKPGEPVCCLVEWVEERSYKFNLPLELLCHPEANVLLLKEGMEDFCQPEVVWLGGCHEGCPSGALSLVRTSRT